MAVSDVDRYALFAFGGKAIQKQRKVKLLPLGANSFGVGFQRAQVIGIKSTRFVEQATNQRAFAVINAAARQETDERCAVELCESFLEGAQKYPSCFFFSIDEGASLSMTRP